MAKILIPLPAEGFDPTETGVPWKALTAQGHEVAFATPEGRVASADPRMVDGTGLGIWKTVLRADANGRASYLEMAAGAPFLRPLPYPAMRVQDWDALLLPGGHAAGMRPFLESPAVAALIVGFFDRDKPLAAICHGVLAAARARRADGRSVLYGRKTTALTRTLELTAWAMTAAWLGSYYRTYPQTVESEVRAALRSAEDFVPGPMALLRDAPARLAPGFTVRDGNYLSARWPGDAHRFAADFHRLLVGQGAPQSA